MQSFLEYVQSLTEDVDTPWLNVPNIISIGRKIKSYKGHNQHDYIEQFQHANGTPFHILIRNGDVRSASARLTDMGDDDHFKAKTYATLDNMKTIKPKRFKMTKGEDGKYTRQDVKNGDLNLHDFKQDRNELLKRVNDHFAK